MIVDDDDYCDIAGITHGTLTLAIHYTSYLSLFPDVYGDDLQFTGHADDATYSCWGGLVQAHGIQK